MKERNNSLVEQGFSIQLATLNDVKSLLSLYKSHHGTDNCVWSENYPNVEMITADITKKGVFVVRDADNNIAATMTVIPMEPDYHFINWTTRDLYEFARLGVDKKYNGLGIASYLFDEMIKYVKTKKTDGIFLLVHPNLQQGIKMYEKRGFKYLTRIHAWDYDFLCYELLF